jgi:hypothetical protein
MTMGKPATINAADEYLNPFALLVPLGLVVEPWDPRAVHRAKKRLLAEMKLDDGRIPWVSDAPLDQARVLSALDELDNVARRECHLRLFMDIPLLAFITSGDLACFDRPVIDIPGRSDGLRTVAWDAFAVRYARALANAVRCGDTATVRRLVGPKFGPKTLSPAEGDACYSIAHAEIKAQVQRLREEAAAAVSNQASAAGMASCVAAEICTGLLNALPGYFGQCRAETARVIRNFSVEICNELGDFRLAKRVLESARLLAVDEATAASFVADLRVLNDNIRGESRHDLDLDICGTRLHMDRRKISFGSADVTVERITAVRWGIYRQYTNGFLSRADFEVGFLSGGKELEIECYRHGFLGMGRNESEASANLNRIVQAAYALVVPGLVNQLVNMIRAGTSLVIGTCLLNKLGVHFSTGSLFWKKDHAVPWKSVGVTVNAGDVVVFDIRNRRVSTTFSIRETWNAVLVEGLTNILKAEA